MLKSTPIEQSNIALPKGGGAIRSIGDTFKPNSFTGTGSYSIPLSIPKSRDFTPALAVNYNSGSGNGIFGLGFSLSLPKIARRTSLGIPKYRGNDVFLLNGAELVLKDNSSSTAGEYTVTEYLMRTEGAFATIKRFVKEDGSDSYWQVTSTKNETMTLGRTDASRISNPKNEQHIFEWLVCEASDAKGNKQQFTYKKENTDNIQPTIWTDGHSYNNRYISSIQYGNYTVKGTEKYAFEVVFDYGEYDLENLDKGGKNPYTPTELWAERPDAFSSFLSGFEIRTCRRCSNILIFHHFEDELGDPYLVKRLAFDYKSEVQYQNQTIEIPSTINGIDLTGYRRKGKNATDAYDIQAMPTLNFGFSELVSPVIPSFHPLQINGKSIPGNLSRNGFFPVDLDQEGIAGLLVENSGLEYFEPKGNGEYAYPKTPRQFPNSHQSAKQTTSFVDLEGNGTLSMVVRKEDSSGFFKGIDSENWNQFKPFNGYPSNFIQPKPESAGLSHNGKTDLLVVNEKDILLYESLGEQGFSSPLKRQKPIGFPQVKKGARQEYCGFVDLLGDGLPHRVQISSGSVACWPDLGYGNFGDKIVLGNAPNFNSEFDVHRLYFADIDGSGTKDIIYAHSSYVEVFFNQSGNSFSDAIEIQLPEPFTDNDTIQFTDVLGNGTTCLVFSKLDQQPRHYFFNFNGEVEINDSVEKAMKPHLLNFIDNNLGATTQIQYSSSINFYLEDKEKGHPWITKLPFPVQVVEQVTVTDQVSKSRYSHRFKYHDGFYDTTERTFRGFGFVESWDSETYGDFDKSVTKQGLTPIQDENFAPPKYTRSWFHTGVSFTDRSILDKYRKDFYKGDTETYHFPDVNLDIPSDQQDVETVRQAFVALRGKLIREEVYADDKVQHPDLYQIPYDVKESNDSVQLYQKLGENPYAVFLVVPRESISYHYERNPKDPRIQQNFVLKTDQYGNTIEACTVYLPRRSNPNNYPQQETLKAQLNWSTWVKPPKESLYCHRSCAQQGFEITGLQLNGEHYFSFETIGDQLKGIDVEKKVDVIPYSAAPTTGVQARQLSWHRIYFWNPALNGAADLGVISELGLYHHKEEAAFDKQFPIDAFNGRIIEDDTYKNQDYLSNIIYTDGGYFYDETNEYWWNKGITQSYYDASKYYLASIAENGFSKESKSSGNPQNASLYSKVEVRYDAYALYKTDLIHYLDSKKKNSVEAEIDYVTLQAYQISDINNNIHQALFDPLGQVIVTSIFGTEDGNDAGGMKLYESGGVPAVYKPTTPPTFEDIVTPDKQSNYLQGASSYFFYDLHTWKKDKQPVCAVRLHRFDYWRSKSASGTPYCETSIEYSDGLGRIAETKKKVPAGIAFLRDKNGGLVHKSGKAEQQTVDSRWQTSGRKVYNNKGKVYKEYLPYFMDSPLYQGGDQVPGPPPKVTIYDPLNREIRINMPKGFFKKVEFTPWEQKHFDENDTLLDSDYYKNVYPTASASEKAAIDDTIHCYNTPPIKILDNLGNAFLQSENNLGSVSPKTFKSISTSGISETEIYDALVSADYLVKDTEKTDLTWVTDQFTPYREGFSLSLPSKFAPVLDAISKILRQNGLWTLLEQDIQGRLVRSIDPRLYYDNITSKKDDKYNFKYKYTMGGKKPDVVDSKDAGTHRKFDNIFNQPFWEWTARDYCQVTGYDTLQRKVTLASEEITHSGIVNDYGSFKLLESFTYGESVSKGVLSNLKGHIYSAKDQSGILTNSSYSMLGEALSTQKQLAKNYKSEIDWNTTVKREPKVYTTTFQFNALKLQIAETTDDKTLTTKEYDEAGKLNNVHVTFADGTDQSAIDSIEYDANDQKQVIKYGNGIVTKYNYEASTLRLDHLVSTRKGSGGAIQNVQQLEYTYDPMGNIMRKVDGSYDDVFYANDKVAPILLYTYDALYRLKTANGRQHVGINADSYQNNASDSFMQSIFGPDPGVKDDDKLENYTAQYDYDDSGNLTSKTRTSQSKKVVSRNLDVEDDSNRLSAYQYDNAGNMLTLNIGSTVDLSFDSFENLTQAGVIKRTGQDDDADYFTYDSNLLRNRKVSERWAYGGTVSQIDESIYIGNYEVINQYQGKTIETSNRVHQRQSLRIMDDTDCVVIINYISQDKSVPSNEKKRTFRFQLDNNMGSVTLEMSEKAELISYEEYFPYGGTAIITGPDEVEVKLKNYRYSGKERDSSTGLYYYGHRYYAPWLGRWIKADPSGTVDGLNVFAFVGGNPTSRTDSDGFNWTITYASGTYKISGSRPGISGVPTGLAAGDMALSFSRTSTGGYNPLLTNPQAAKFIDADNGKRRSAGIALCHILSANYIANMFVHILNNSSSASSAISSLQKMHEATTGLTSSGLASATSMPSTSDLSSLLNGMARHIHNLPIGHSRTNSSIQEHDDFEVVGSSAHGFMFSPRAMRALNFRLEMKEKYTTFDHAAYNPRTVVASGKTFIKSSTGLLEHDGHYYIGAHDLYATHRQALEALTGTSTATAPPVYSYSTSTVTSMDYVATTTHPTYTATPGYAYSGQYTSQVSSGTVRKGGTQGSLF